MKKTTKFLLTMALLIAGVGGVNSVKGETIVTKTPIILTGGKFAESFTPGTYIIQMQGWQSFIVYENAEGISFDENSTMVFDLAEKTSNTSVRVTFSFFDGTNTTNIQYWWLLGIGNNIEDTSPHYGNPFDNSTYFLKKAFGNDFETLKLKKITKVTVDNFNYSIDDVPQLVTYKVNGGTICGQNMTIKNSNATTFGAYGGVFSATTAQTNIFKMENFNVGDYQKVVFKFGEAVPSTGNWAYNYQSGVYPPSIPVGATELEIPLNGTTLPELTIFNWNANPDPINISEVYFYKEEESDILLTFNDYGFATSNNKDLVAEGGLSYDPATGVLTTDGTAGTLTLEFTTPVDLKYLNKFTVNRSGNDNIIDNVKFYDADGGEINTWNNSKLHNDGLDNNATNAFINHNPVKKMVWSSAAGKSTDLALTITGITWQLKTMSCVNAGETVLNTLPWIKISDGKPETPNWNMHTATDTYYGNYSGDATHYVDLTAYSELRIYRDNNDPCRAFFINAAGTGTNQANTGSATWNAEKKYWSFNLSGIEKYDGKVALKCIKANQGVSNLTVNNIAVYNTPAANAPKYVLAGSGMQLAETVAALADATATSIDATGVIGITTNSEAGRTLLTSANPNCLFLGTTGNGGLANTQNVINGSTCANLVLTDGHPFKAPADFTATSATYNTTINTTAQAGTLCLPFAAAIPEGVTAYTLAYSSGNTATATPVETTIPANTPVLLNGSGEKTFTGSSAVNASATNTSGALTGVFESTTVPVDSYVLQNGEDGLGFYKVNSAITAAPFRAYLTATSTARSLNIVYADEATGISSVRDSRVSQDGVYTLSGQRVSQPKKGLYVVNGKKMMVK